MHIYVCVGVCVYFILFISSYNILFTWLNLLMFFLNKVLNILRVLNNDLFVIMPAFISFHIYTLTHVRKAFFNSVKFAILFY